jgi:hypothetical protein
VSNVEPRDWSVESQTVEDTTQNLLPASLNLKHGSLWASQTMAVTDHI